jgi:glycosyltransferase involved in cell wall biosynthesis
MEKVYCLVPLYNDWESFDILLKHLEHLQEKSSSQYLFSVLIVNDGSSEKHNATLLKNSTLDPIVINLKINVGHQRAIAVGLQYVHNEINDFDYLIVMDSDGEDKPEDILLLIEKSKKQATDKIIFAQRNKRQESFIFKLGYFFYKKIFKSLTGQKISFGNFSLIPRSLLVKVVHQNNIWNHYSGGIIQSKILYDTVLLDRGKRFTGLSKMNFNSLVLHGLSSIAVYFDYLSVKILKLSLCGILLCFLSVIYILSEKLFTNTAIPGWASSLILIVSGIILQLFSVTLVVLLLQLSARKNIVAPNSKIYLDFIESIEKL